MSVDKGGLHYPITVEDDFSDVIAVFKKDITDAAAAWKAFKSTLSGDSGLTDANAEFEALTVNVEDASAALKAFAAAEKAAQAAASSTSLKNETTNVTNLTNAYQRLANAKKQAAANSGAAVGPPANVGGAAAAIGGAGAANAGALTQALQGLSQAQGVLSGISSFLDSITPKFSTLLTTLAGFFIIRTIASGFTELVKGIVSFNAEVEKAELGMASLFLATGDVRDALGQAVTPAQGLALAQTEARKQTQLLRQDALSTSATFEALLKTFQTSIAPGLNAGLDVDQIRKFSVAITQAASVIGVADDRIAHEVRDILSGTINNSRGDRIAKALGIDNQSIANAKQQGQLVEFLNQKFNAFTVASAASLNTFDVILKNVKSAFDQVIGNAGLDFFNKIKDSLKEIFGFLTLKDNISGALTPSPEAVAIIKVIADALGVAFDNVKNLIEGFGPEGLLKAATVVGEAIKIISQVLVGVVRGFLDALPALTEIATFIRDSLKSATGIDLFNTANLTQSIAYLTKIGVLFGAGLVATKAIAAATSFVTDGLKNTLDILKKVGPEGVAIGGTLAGLGGSVSALGFLVFNQFLKPLITGQQAVKVVGGQIATGITEVGTKTEATAKSAVKLSDAFKNLPGIVSATAEHAKDFDKTLESIVEDIEKTTLQLQQENSLLGLSGNVLKERQDIFNAEIAAREKTRAILGEEKEAQTLLLGLQTQKLANQNAINKLDQEGKDLVGAGVKAGTDTVNTLREIASLQAKITEQSKALQVAQAAGNKEDVTNLGNSLRNLNEEKDTLEKQLAAQNKASNEITSDLPVKQSEQINGLIIQRLTLLGEESVANERLKALKQDQTLIEQGLNAAAANRLSITAQQDAFQVTNENKIAQAQASAAAATFAARNALTPERNLVAAQNEVSILQAQVAQERLLRDLRLQSLQVLLAQQQAQAALLHDAAQAATDPSVQTKLYADEKAILGSVAALQAQINVYQQQNTILTSKENTELAKVTENLQHQQEIVAHPFAQGLIDGFKQAAQAIPGLYQGIVDLVKGTITSFTDFVSQSIVDAFDPTKDGTLQQRFAQFLQGIAKQVLNLFFQLAIQKAILGLGFLGGGGPVGAAGALGGLGFAEGGEIPHARARGYAAGDLIRPKGLYSSDRIPIWAAAGEFMMRLKAVKLYGANVMSRINAGVVNPIALRAVAGIGGTTPILPPNRSGGYAGGGTVSGSPSSGASVIPAVIVSNEDNVEKFLAGGKNALFRALESDKKRLRAIVG